MPRWGASSSKEAFETLQDPEDKYSLKHMLFLSNLCEKYAAEITPKTQELMVETFRQLAEVILWGDQHDPQFFDIFLEKTVLAHLMQVLQQDVVLVKIQLLQTLSILIQNLKSEMALFYLLSNNYINDLITYKWDFTNEDVLANYVSFLKTISLKLNARTIQFFFNGMKNTFPLYTEAIKFHDNKESMVRIAVRTLSLNVYKVDDALMQKFVIEQTSASYFSNIILSFAKLCKRANIVLEKPNFSSGELQDIMEELLDIIYYLHDILALNIEKMSRILTFHLVEYLVIPIFAANLCAANDKPDSNPVVTLKPQLTVYLIAQFFFIFTHGNLVNAAGAILVHPKPQQYNSFYKLIPQLEKFNVQPNFASLSQPETKEKENSSNVADTPSQIDSLYSSMVKPKQTPKEVEKPKNTFTTREVCSAREDLLSFLEKDDDQLILGVLTVLYAIIRNTNLERKLLSQSGLFPHRLEKVQSIFDLLVSDDSTAARSSGDLFGDSDSSSDLFADNSDKEASPDEFNKKIIDALMSILLHGEKYRIVTLELTLTILKELVYSETQKPKLTDKQKDKLDIAYTMSTANLRDRLVNSEVGEVFLELFEDEMKSFKPVYFEGLITDYTLLCPIPEGPCRGYSFTMRLPSGDLEETKKAVQGFLLTRKLKYTLQKEKDTLLPLQESKSRRTEINLEIGKKISVVPSDCFVCHVTAVNGVGERILTTEGPYLAIVCPVEGKENTGIVQELLELQNIEVAVSQGEPKILLTKAGSVTFDSEEECCGVKNWIESAKQRVRHQKLEQLYELLGIDTKAANNISKRKSVPLIGDQLKPCPSQDALNLDLSDSSHDDSDEIELKSIEKASEDIIEQSDSSQTEARE